MEFGRKLLLDETEGGIISRYQLLAVLVTSAAVDDAAAAPRLLGKLTREAYPRLLVT